MLHRSSTPAVRAIALLSLAALAACQPTATCPPQGAHFLFAGDFETATVGSAPPAGGALVYGPPGSAIAVSAGTSALVEQSAALGGRALRIARTQGGTQVDFVLGSLGGVVGNRYVVRMRLMGDPVPAARIASSALTLLSATGQSAVTLGLYAGTYHHFRNGALVPLTGSYDPSTPHVLLLAVDLDARTYLVCVNNQVLAHDEALLDPAFGTPDRLRASIGPEITEAFSSALVIDELRVTR